MFAGGLSLLPNDSREEDCYMFDLLDIHYWPSTRQLKLLGRGCFLTRYTIKCLVCLVCIIGPLPFNLIFCIMVAC